MCEVVRSALAKEVACALGNLVVANHVQIHVVENLKATGTANFVKTMHVVAALS